MGQKGKKRVTTVDHQPSFLMFFKPTLEYIFGAPSIRRHSVLNFPFIALHSFPTKNTELLIYSFSNMPNYFTFQCFCNSASFFQNFFYPLVHLTMLKILQNPVLGNFPTYLLQPGKLVTFSVISLYIQYQIYIYHTGYNCLFLCLQF